MQVILTQGISENYLTDFPLQVSRTTYAMKLFVNSEQKNFSGKNIAELVQSLQITSTNGIALAVNEKVISKSSWEQFQLNESDKIIIIKATQGG